LSVTSVSQAATYQVFRTNMSFPILDALQKVARRALQRCFPVGPSNQSDTDAARVTA